MRAHAPKLGLLLPTWTGAMDGATPGARDVLAVAQRAEAVGFDAVWLSDHFYFEPFEDFQVVGVEFPDTLRGVKAGAWECWSLAAALAVATASVEIGTMVSSTGFRNPALMARLIDTVDDLSGGRVIAGLGAGDFVTEHAAFGFPFERRVSRFEEALAIVCPLLRGERVSFAGEFHRAEGAQLLPKAARAGGPPILIGSLRGGPRMSRLVARYADHWNFMLGFGESTTAAFEAAWAPIRAGCEKHGRDPASLVRNATLSVSLADTPFPIPGAVPLRGAPDALADAIAGFASLGVGYVTLMLHPWTVAGVEAFGAVIERLRR